MLLCRLSANGGRNIIKFQVLFVSSHNITVTVHCALQCKVAQVLALWTFEQWSYCNMIVTITDCNFRYGKDNITVVSAYYYYHHHHYRYYRCLHYNYHRNRLQNLYPDCRC